VILPERMTISWINEILCSLYCSAYWGAPKRARLRRTTKLVEVWSSPPGALRCGWTTMHLWAVRRRTCVVTWASLLSQLAMRLELWWACS